MKRSTAWALVGAQFGLIIGLIVLPPGELWQRSAWAAVVAGVLVVAGIALAASAGLRLGPALTPLPIPKDGTDLVTTGLYRWVRHPIYTGVVLAGLGLVVWGASPAHVLGFAALYVVLFAKSVGEEKMLASRHEDYAAYVAKTGRLVPKLFHVQRGNA